MSRLFLLSPYISPTSSCQSSTPYWSTLEYRVTFSGLEVCQILCKQGKGLGQKEETRLISIVSKHDNMYKIRLILVLLFCCFVVLIFFYCFFQPENCLTQETHRLPQQERWEMNSTIPCAKLHRPEGKRTFCKHKTQGRPPVLSLKIFLSPKIYLPPVQSGGSHLPVWGPGILLMLSRPIFPRQSVTGFLKLG